MRTRNAERGWWPITNAQIPRPLRLELAGDLYHETSRGDRREYIYRDDTDRLAWFTILAQVCERYNWWIHACCQRSNHYHLIVATAEDNLSAGMRQLNGVYTQHANRRHRRGCKRIGC